MKLKKFWGSLGFTLIEMMVALSIAGVLMAIAIPKFSRWPQREFVRFDGQTSKFGISETSKLWHWADWRDGRELKVWYFVSLFRN